MATTTFQPRGDVCPHCGSRIDVRSSTVLAADGPDRETEFEVLACSACRFAWQWPIRRSAQESRAFFDRAYGEAREGTYFHSSRKAAIAKLEFDFVTRFFGSPGRLLDVGAGDGTFCTIAHENGWQVVGVDPALPHPRESNGLHLVRGTLAEVPDGGFDAVTLWDVIEHVETPAALLEEARQKLRPGGFAFVETGNYMSYNRIAQDRRWWAYQLDHKWYFNPDVLMALLKRAAFLDPVLCPRMLRPEWKGHAVHGLINHLKLAARFRPVTEHRELDHVRRAGWRSLDIFAVAARRGEEPPN